MQKTFGALAYPEWRIEVVERAQKAGMGDIGSALRWVMWRSERQFVRDLEEVRKQRDESAAGGMIVRARRGTVGSRSSRKYRRSMVPTAVSAADAGSDDRALSDSDVSDESGRFIVDSDSEESSEAEWQGWMADLFRQQKVQAQAKRKKREAEAAAAAAKLADPEDGERVEEHPRTPAEDRRHQVEKRRALEPVGIVTTMYSNTPTSTGAYFYEALLWMSSQADCDFQFFLHLQPPSIRLHLQNLSLTINEHALLASLRKLVLVLAHRTVILYHVLFLHLPLHNPRNSPDPASHILHPCTPVYALLQEQQSTPYEDPACLL
jgi:hypothetical protein